MNTNEIIWQVLRSGFPLLILVVYGMLITSVWQSEKFDQGQRWKWTSIIAGPGILAFIIFLAIVNSEIESQIFMNAMFVVLIFLPFSGVLAWLVGTR
ncbi:MAG: hypothetical protein AAGD28_19350 [Bacteroidota bacterium]